jgi:CheY-like chemotaxis protein
MSDPDRLQQVLNNIIKNAIKYTEFGEIQLSYSLKDNYLHFCVEDSGIGIPKDEQQFVFEIFRQVGRDGDQAGSDINKSGTGLGLSISKALIEKMGGRIHLESSLGHGTKVNFTLPYVKGERKESKQKRTMVKGEKWADKKMLIVEDDLVSIELYYELLENTGVEIIVAKTGDEAIKKIELIPQIDIVLMDIRLPGMSGLKATEKIKQINKTVPVIAQTAYAMQDDKKKSLSSGCDGFISKPINSNEFFNLIDTFLK